MLSSRGRLELNQRNVKQGYQILKARDLLHLVLFLECCPTKLDFQNFFNHYSSAQVKLVKAGLLCSGLLVS